MNVMMNGPRCVVSSFFCSLLGSEVSMAPKALFFGGGVVNQPLFESNIYPKNLTE